MHEITGEHAGLLADKSDQRLDEIPGGWVRRLNNWVVVHPHAPLLLALVLSVLVRLLLVIRTHAMIDGDEAMVGLQAEGILHGQYPTYFYGQPYMGSLEAYIAAALFRIFGPSSWALRMIPIALSLLLVYLIWRLANALLPRDARTTPLLAGLAALLAAVPPLYDAVTELRTWGGQIEVYSISIAMLLVTVGLTQRMQGEVAGKKANTGALVGQWALLGLLAGLGIWINPLVIFALIACAFWLLLPLIARWRRDGAGAALFPPLALLPGLALGGLPAWVYAVQNHAENLLVYVQQPTVSPAVSGAARHGRLFLGAAITARYASCVAPNVLDGGLPTESPLFLPLRYLLLLVPLLAIIMACWLLLRRMRSPIQLGLPLLYAGISAAIFCLGTSAWAATKSCDRDWAGRYAVPLGLMLPLLLLALFAAPRLWQVIRQRGQNRQISSSTEPAAVRHTQQMTFSSRGITLVLLVLVVFTGLQLVTYGLTSPSQTFQSPYYRQVPLNEQPLLDYLNIHHIHAAWANHWLGNIVSFETNGATVCADYYDEVVQNGLRRPPGTLAAVSAANAPSFILIGQGTHPLLAQELDQQGIPYTLTVIPGTTDITVITPARTVDPASVVNGLAVDYAY